MLIRFRCTTIATGLLFGTLGAWTAPLFPDVKDDHWAKDAVATLAAKGLLEGYPNGTFKGDRAASRWEVALMVARLLAKMEGEHATFASKADLEAVRKLAQALHEELDALGVRVTTLEERTTVLDTRVTELERITFYGTFDAKIIGQSFYNTGNSDNNDQRGAVGTPGTPFINYNSAVGSTLSPIYRPQIQGVYPVVDYRNGRALVNGAGYTAKLMLGVKAHISADVDAGMELAAFSSQGNQFVDSYWGISAPYLSNAFTANNFAGSGLAGNNNAPFTRMTLDNFWLLHKPSKTKLIVGYYDKLRMDPLVYAGQPNLGVFGPKRFGGYGFNVTGEFSVGEQQSIKWEALGSRFGDGNLFGGTNYDHHVYGANIAYEQGQVGAGKQFLTAKLNFARSADDGVNGGPLTVGLESSGTNVAYAASGGYTPLQWVNPAGYFARQRSPFEQANTGATGPTQPAPLIPNTVDTRPITGWNGSFDNAVGLSAGGGNYGPQGQSTYGLSGRYDLPIGEKSNLRLAGELAFSQYKPNKNSSYSSNGSAYRLELGSVLAEGDLDLAINYLSVDPNYNPSLYPGNQLGVRLVRGANYTGRFHLDDFITYPRNREGVQAKLRWDFDEKHGQLGLRGSFLNQKQTSLYDVRVLGGSLGPAIPTNNVLGFSPGFVDAVFSGFADPAIYGAGSASSFDAQLQPLENPRGKVTELGLNFFYKFDEPKLRLDFAVEHQNFQRNSSLSAALGGSQNQVNLNVDYVLLGVNWTVSPDWSLRGGSEWVSSRGHLDPAGLYNGHAIRTNSTSFSNLDSLQTIPFVGVDYNLSKDTVCSLDFHYYSTVDNLDNVPAGATSANFGGTAHPFSWQGLQVSTELHTKF